MAQGIVVVGSGVDPASYYNKTQVDNALAKKLDKTGGEVSGQVVARNVPGFADFAAISSSETIDTGFMAQNTATGMQVSFGIASNGTLAGMYDHAQTRWIIAVPAGLKDVYFAGDRHIFENYIDFLQKNVGLRWWNKNGSKFDIRNQAEQNLFQITLTPVDGTPEYGVLNVFENKSMELDAYGSLLIRDCSTGQQSDLFKGVVVASGGDYIRFGNGTQICWGTSDVDRGGTVPFQVPFASAPALTFAVGNGETDSDFTINFWWSDIQSTYFVFGVKDYSAVTISWIAIGRWM